jgi:hypothetical protein
MSRARVSAVVAAVVVVVGLGAWLLLRGQAEPTAQPEPSPLPVTTPTREPVGVPLTGLPLTDPAALDRPAVAVKVSDVRQANPQVGVDRADLVFVEPIGVGTTRLAAVFHSDLPDTVGPVRSVRPADIPLLSPLNPVFAHTMAAQWVLDYLADAGRVDSLGSLQVPASSDAYVVDDARPRPDHVLARPSELVDLATTADVPPAPYFAYADDAAGVSAADGTAAGTVTVPYGPGWDVRWTFDAESGRYLRDQPWGPHVTADGSRVGATNVLVLEVASRPAEESASVPVLQLVDASGPLWALAGGRVVPGTWSKGGVDDLFVLTTRTGEPLLLAPGITWVELPSTAPSFG